MGEAANELVGMLRSEDRFDHSAKDLREMQIAAINERFQERRDAIRLLAMRAGEAGIGEVRSLADIVPLLFPHTAYKSYPESFLVEGRWDRLTKWLGTISAYPTDNADLEGVADIDEWVGRLGAAGHFISASSGTTGKSAMLIGSRADMDFSSDDAVRAFAWGSGVAPGRDRVMFGLAPVAAVPRNLFIRDALQDAFGRPDAEPFRYPVPPITIGSITRMIVLRKKIADGSARPGEVAEFGQSSAERQRAVDGAIGISADALVAARGEKLFVSGMWASLYPIAAAVRERGHRGADFHPGNCIYVGGGLKGAQLPPDYREFVYETFNIAPEQDFAMYGMQEIGTSMPRCQKGRRYHIPPWLVPLVLDESGESLVAHQFDGEIEGRAAFFDISLDGRWGGVISGDRIALDYRACACGNRSPSIRDDIARYTDLKGDDKIGCAGTVDAYVRGMA
jgi:hypothetical protein